MSELKAETIVPQGSAITLQMYPKGEADAALAAKDKEIAELKEQLESEKASRYAESVDAGMRERRLKRALWLMASAVHKAKRKHYEDLLHRMTMWEGTPAGLRMHKAIDKFSGYERKCRAKAEEYKSIVTHLGGVSAFVGAGYLWLRLYDKECNKTIASAESINYCPKCGRKLMEAK